MTHRPRRIVIVAYGAAPLLARTLGALAPNEQVTVVDNSSSTEVRTTSQAANVKYVDPGENLGFGAAVNVALRDFQDLGVDADVLLLNPDATICSGEIDALQRVFSSEGNDNVGAVSPALASPDGVRQRVLWPYPSPNGMWREALGFGRFGKPRRQFVIGAVLFLRREALAAVGYFDERYFLYAEETDWQRRASDLGWRSVVVAEVTAMHVGGGTSVDLSRRDLLFHAAKETYIRRWFGPTGWISYRLAALLGAICRTVLTRGADRRTAWARARVYLAGPRRKAGSLPPRSSLRVTHVVVTDKAAGSERYVSEVATLQAAAGHQVTVVGGDQAYMQTALPRSVTLRSGETVWHAMGALKAAGSQDIVHTHLSSADFSAIMTARWHGGRIVSTRHIAKRRGRNFLIRMPFQVLQRRIAVEVCMSDYVKRAVGSRASVLPNGVCSDARNASGNPKIVLLAQRLERDKSTEIALAGWASSGLADQGWVFVICGDGSQRSNLQRLALELGADGVEWRGWVDDVRSIMLTAAVLVAPCSCESFGFAVVEAMSVGLPVVAAAGGGHLQTVGLCAQSMMFAPGDSADCRRQLLALAAMDPVERRRYGQALKRLQRNRFDVVDHVHRLDDIYRSVLR